MSNLTVRTGTARSFGYQRRADKDHPGYQAWEEPNGMLHFWKSGAEPLLSMLRNPRWPQGVAAPLRGKVSR